MEENNNQKKEHPKFQIESMSDTREAISAYAAAHKLAEQDAVAELILNELRCMHWHLDIFHEKFIEKNKKQKNERQSNN